MNKIIANIPITQTGYSKHAFLLIKEFILKNECQIIPIGGVDFPEFVRNDPELFAKTQECLSRPVASNIYFKFWHEHALIADTSCEHKIGFSTFEVNDIVVKTNCDLILTASNWGREVLENIDYRSDVIFGRLPLPEYEYSEQPTEFLNIGKFEFRKQTQYLAETFIFAAQQTKKKLKLNLVCHNMFTGSAVLEQLLPRYGFSRIGTEYTKDNLTINIVNTFISEYDLLALKKKCIPIYPGGSEGANLSLLESLNYSLVTKKERFLIEPIYCPTTAHADLNEYVLTKSIQIETVKAYDGIFFKNPNTTNLFYRIEQKALIDRIINAPNFIPYEKIQSINTIDKIFYDWINEEKWRG